MVFCVSKYFIFICVSVLLKHPAAGLSDYVKKCFVFVCLRGLMMDMT